MIHDTNLRQYIRKHIRYLRNNLPKNIQQQESKKLTTRIIHNKHIMQAQTIALFMSFDGEIQTYYLIKKLLNLRKRIYLPVLNPNKKSRYLLFSQYVSSTPLIYNYYKILEPKWNFNTLISIKKLHIMFVPLVAFDNRGYRLGMGGGFYDRTLQYWANKAQLSPIGLGYDFQEIPRIPAKQWDFPLPEIITPSRHLHF